MAKDRIIPELETERPLMAPDPVQEWWTEKSTTHGASGVGTRATRHTQRKRRQIRRQIRRGGARVAKPGWTVTIMIVALVVVLGMATVLFLDLRRGLEPAAPQATTSAAERPSGRQVDPQLVSPDTVREHLIKAGFEVEPLTDSYDQTRHGYDVSDTIINRNKAQILAFPDKSTARDFVNVTTGTGYVIVWKDLWAISLGQGEDAKPLAEKIGNKLNARFAWTPQGE